MPRLRRVPSRVSQKSEIDAAIKEIAKGTKAAETQAVIDKAALLAKLGITADEFKQLLV